MGIKKNDTRSTGESKFMSKYILKLARCIQELERIKGVRVGGNGSNRYGAITTNCRNSKTPQITQEDIAKQFGVSVKKAVLLIETTKCPLCKINGQNVH